MKMFLIGLLIFIVLLILLFIWCACKICKEASLVEEQKEAEDYVKTLQD